MSRVGRLHGAPVRAADLGIPGDPAGRRRLGGTGGVGDPPGVGGPRDRDGPRDRNGPHDDAGTFLGAVTEVAAALRSGAVPAVAWQRGLGVRVVDGVPLWSDLATRWPDDVVAARAVHTVARLSAELGAAPASLLDEVAAGLGREAEADAERRAALAGPQATARILAWLPALGLLLGVALGADPFAVLLDGGPGTALLVVGALLTWAGHRWTRRYLRAAEDAGREG